MGRAKPIFAIASGRTIAFIAARAIAFVVTSGELIEALTCGGAADRSITAESPWIRSTTFSAYLEPGSESGDEEHRAPCGELNTLIAGSWVHGTLATWIGSADKNRAWDLLCAAKASFDLVLASGRLSDEQRAAACSQLADCESSDWFWWLGDYNPAEAVAVFEAAFRAKLANLYRLLDLPVPANLSEPISQGRGHPESGGAMRRAS